ncbi:uncharacterized protein LOC141915029 [Tubulanus polymorphus]|uniref:uncharacterized protein LOC141915029 n=1 Tax=Tubulanus polymorphus TaxID=672921 RepID=UPI003DA3A3CC
MMVIIFRISIFVCILAVARSLFIEAGCGGFIAPGAADTGLIQTPGYPTNYSILDKCIWTIQAPLNHQVKLIIMAVHGEVGSDGTCNDYLEVRDGNASAPLLFHSCSSTSNVTLYSSSRWMWMKFFSNYMTTNYGFKSVFSFSYKAAPPMTTDYVVDCKGFQYTCPNKECISISYMCDGQNDCGFVGGNSDESDENCKPFSLPLDFRMGVGVAIGIVSFILVVLLAAATEGYCRCGKGTKYTSPQSSGECTPCLPCCNKSDGSRRPSKVVKRTSTNPAILILTGENEKFEQMERDGKLRPNSLISAMHIGSNANAKNATAETPVEEADNKAVTTNLVVVSNKDTTKSKSTNATKSNETKV